MSTYEPRIDPLLYGLNVPYNRGWDAWSRRNAPRAEDVGSSGFFSYNEKQIDLWITEVSADFSLSGQQGQSRMLREFFPRSFNDVTLQIKGNVANTQQYNRLAAFIREAHWRALHAINSGSNVKPTITFALQDHTPLSWTSNRGVKGRHRPWVVEGYVKTVKAGAIKHEIAPEFDISFIVAQSQLTSGTGLWDDQPAGIRPLKSMLEILGIERTNGKIPKGFIQNPDIGNAINNAAWSVQSAVQALQGFGF